MPSACRTKATGRSRSWNARKAAKTGALRARCLCAACRTVARWPRFLNYKCAPLPHWHVPRPCPNRVLPAHTEPEMPVAVGWPFSAEYSANTGRPFLSTNVFAVASTAAFQPGPGMAVYFATKAFVLSFSEALHEELRKDGVVVTALCPGPTATEFGEVAGWKPAGPSAKIFVDMAADSASVVRAGLEGVEKRRAIVVPGVINKSTAQAHRFFPRSWVRKAAGSIKL